MKLAGMFIAETADFTGETLQVKGGLWDGLRTSAWPAAHKITVVALLRPDLQDVGVSHHLDFHLDGPDGQSAGHVHFDVQLNVHRPQVPVIVTLPATMPVPGRYRISLKSLLGYDSVFFDLVGPEGSAVSDAVEGYALGLRNRT